MSKPLEPLREFLRVHFRELDGRLYRKICTNVKQSIGEEVGWLHPEGYRRCEIDGKSYATHRLVFLMSWGFMPEEIDHVNGIKDDNRIHNLRPCTHAENMRNACKHISSITGVKGVTLKSNGKYRVRITVDGRLLDLGTFDDLELAAFIVSEARNKYHKEFANDG